MYGLGNIKFTTLTPPAGAPFPAGSADNGLSVDPVTGKIVLGNDLGSVLAELLSDRYIPTDIFSIYVQNLAATQQNRISNFGLEVTGGGGSTQALLVADSSNNAYLNVRANLDPLAASGPDISMTDFAGNTYMSFHPSVGTWEFGDIDGGQGSFLYQQINNGAFQVMQGMNRATSITPSLGLWQIGDIDGAFTPSGTSINVDGRLNDPALVVNNGGIETADSTVPFTNGPGTWRLGTAVAAASVLDGTQYVEVDIQGSIYKLALIQ